MIYLTVNVDVIIVSALALPVVLVGLLLVLAVTGNLDP